MDGYRYSNYAIKCHSTIMIIKVDNRHFMQEKCKNWHF